GAREHAQQRRLARAVRADDERDLTRADREIEPFEQAMLAAPDCERARVEPGCLGHERPASAQRKCRWYSDLRGKSKVVYSTRNRRGRQLVANNKGFPPPPRKMVSDTFFEKFGVRHLFSGHRHQTRFPEKVV